MVKQTREEARRTALTIYDRTGDNTRVVRAILAAFHAERGTQQIYTVRAALEAYAKAEGVTYEA